MFGKIENGKQPVYEDRYTEYSEGLVNAITGVTVNNGVGFYTTREGKQVYEDRLTIAKDGEYAGTTYLQTSEFVIAGHSIGLLDNIGVGNNELLYLASCFNKYKDVGFWRLGGVMGSVTMGRLTEVELELPVLTTEDTTPYWDYMAYFIHNIQHQYADQLEAKSEYELNLMCQILGVTREDIVQRVEYQQPQYINKFKVGELFGVTGTKSTNAGTLEFKDCGVEFIGRTSVNNGVQGYIDELEYAPNEEGTITVSQVGTIVAQYRGEPYYTSQNIAKLEYNRKLSKEEGLYFVTRINKHLQIYGGYQTPKLDDIKNIILELPVLAPNSKQIDWGTIRHDIIWGGGINYLATRQDICNRDLAIIRKMIQ